ncbi:MAG: FliH/SctL family protein [bacterium]
MTDTPHTAEQPDEASAFEPVPADELEAWALAHAPGWTRRDDLDAIDAVSARIAALERELADLEALRQQHIDDARAEGLNTAARDAHTVLAALSTRLRAQFETTVDTAADAVLAVAETLVGRALAADPDQLRAMLAQRLAGRPADTLRAIRVAPQHAEHLAATDPDHLPWRADPTLGPGDAIVDLADGQLDLRLAAVLSLLRGDVRGALDLPSDP